MGEVECPKEAFTKHAEYMSFTEKTETNPTHQKPSYNALSPLTKYERTTWTSLHKFTSGFKT